MILVNVSFLFKTFNNNSTHFPLQPVYTDDPNDEEDDVGFKTMRRSSSCPNLSLYHEETPKMGRKRAKSVFHPADADLLRATNLDRVHSESDLSRIDRRRTFDESNRISRPNDILAQVVTALGTINVDEDDDEDYDSELESGGIHGFSDSDILASEKNGSGWSLAYSDGSAAVPPSKERARAASDFRAPTHLYDNDEHKWTWSANNSQIKEFMRLRKINKGKDLYRASFAVPKPTMNGNSVTINVTGPDEKPDSTAFNAKSVWGKLNPFKKRSQNDGRLSVSPDPMEVQKYLDRTGTGRNTNTPKQFNRRTSLCPDQAEVQRYLDQTSVGRNTRKSISAKHYLSSSSSRGRQSIASGLTTTDEATEDILENTTIADLIRALEMAHTRANTADTPLMQEFFDVPKRKLGTVTPPSTVTPVLGLFSVAPPSDRGRRGSMMPSSTQTPILNRVNMGRRQSHVADLLGHSQRRMSLRPMSSSLQPPPLYSHNNPTPKLTQRRFSVRPTTLSVPPGQAPASYIPSKQASSGVQRKLSMVPSPLTRDTSSNIRSSVRFARTLTSSNVSSENASPTSGGTPVASKRESIFRTQQPPPNRPRHGSMAHIFQRNPNMDRKRTESK